MWILILIIGIVYLVMYSLKDSMTPIRLGAFFLYLCGGIFGLAGIIMLIMGATSTTATAEEKGFYIGSSVLVIIISIALLFGGKIESNKAKEEEEAYANQLKKEQSEKEIMERWEQNEYPSLLTKYDVPMDAKTVGWIKSSSTKQYYIWIDNSTLKLFPVLYEGKNKRICSEFTLRQIYDELHNISLSSIEYYKIGGVKSEWITHGTRILRLWVANVPDLNNGERCYLPFELNDFQTLEDLIPEKNYDVVSTIKKNKLVQQSVKIDETKIITEQIKELAVLKNEGIFTGDEKSPSRFETDFYGEDEFSPPEMGIGKSVAEDFSEIEKAFIKAFGADWRNETEEFYAELLT